jgi:hypothetical protein
MHPFTHPDPAQAWELALSAHLRQEDSLNHHIMDRVGNPISALLLMSDTHTSTYQLAAEAVQSLRKGIDLLTLEASCWHSILPSLARLAQLQAPAGLVELRLRSIGQRHQPLRHSWIAWMHWCLLRDMLTTTWGCSRRIALSAQRRVLHTRWSLTLAEGMPPPIMVRTWRIWAECLSGSMQVQMGRNGVTLLVAVIPHAELARLPFPPDIAQRTQCPHCAPTLQPFHP